MKSATRSSGCSRPTEHRTSPGPMPAASSSSGSSEAWVELAGLATSVSGPPNEGGHAGQLDRLDERAPGVEPTGEVEAEQRTAGRHLALRQLVLRVRFEPGIVHVGDGRVVLEEPGEGEGRRALALDPHAHRPDAAQPVVGVVRRGDRTVQDGVAPDVVDQVLLPRHHTEGRVVVTADPLGRRVHHQADAVTERLLQSRRREGRVHQRERAPDGGEFVEIDERQLWVRRRLGDHEHRLARPPPRRRRRRVRSRRPT